MVKLFTKKKEEEEDYEDEEEEEKPRKKLSKKSFRDLKPENRKRRKEPPRPWGRKERLLVFAVLVLTAGTSAFLAFDTRNWKLPGMPRFKAPSFSLPFFGEQTIIIEGDKKDQEKAAKAISEFERVTRRLSGIYGLYVLRLNDGSSYGVNELETFQAASLIKLPVMLSLYKEAEEGNINLDAKYKLKKSDKTAGSGSLSGKPEGYLVTYRELIRLMGKQSDNTAFTIAVNTLGKEKINQTIKELGMIRTSYDDNETTPADIGLFFERLYTGRLISDKAKDEFMNNLTGSIYEEWLVAGVPANVRVIHKYGREIHVVNDAGIVETSEPFVIVLLTKGIVEKEADEVLPELAKIIYDIETSGVSN